MNNQKDNQKGVDVEKLAEEFMESRCRIVNLTTGDIKIELLGNNGFSCTKYDLFDWMNEYALQSNAEIGKIPAYDTGLTAEETNQKEMGLKSFGKLTGIIILK